MPEIRKEGKASVGNASSDKNLAFGKRPKPRKGESAYKLTPLYMYRFKDMVRQIASDPQFPDALAAIFALIAVSSALPLYPLPILVLLVLATFVVTMFQPLLGLMVLLFETFPMFVYQIPLVAWLFTIFMSLSFFLGYKHYRSIIFIYALMAIPFSPFGFFLELPTFVITILTIGLRRGAIAAAIAVIVVSASSGISGIPNTGSIAFNSTQTFGQVMGAHVDQFVVPTKAALGFSNFTTGLSSSTSTFLSFAVAQKIFSGMALGAVAIINNFPLVILQIIAWVFVVYVISNTAVKSRSKFKGARASLFSVIIPLTYLGLSYLNNLPFNSLTFVGFLIIPIILFTLEYYDITVVRALEVMKQDFRGRFGEMYEDLSTGTRETLDDVANYDDVKQELKEAVLAPIEKRELAGAYNIKPPKGILLFGPPGTGKTYLMRALANELRAGFFYIKASQILSPYPGQSAQTIERIFNVAKKHTPCIIFFDEIDNIASNRELQESETGRQILSTLLSEMDGFQTIEGVVIVGATNVPQFLDPSIMRAGRFDKILYIPLPNALGRKKILQQYFKKLPITSDLDYDKLAQITDRYSGADIKNLSENVARQAADEAAEKNKVLKITLADIVSIIKVTKPSTSLAQVDKYNAFKLDYERRTHQGQEQDASSSVSIDEVVGLDDAKKALHEAVELPILHPELLKKYDIKNIKGILMFGPPGTGKTMLMRAVASELGDVHLITMSGGEISKYGPERAIESIRQTFDRAKENSPSIIFIDEIDAVVPARDQATEKGVQFTGEFLEELDGIKSQYNIVLVATTNRPDMLDPALLRPGRIDKIIYVAPPNREEREQLFRYNLAKAPTQNEIDFGKLAEITPGYTGADITNICRQAKMNALEHSIRSSGEELISTEMMVKIIQSIKPSAPSAVVGRYLAFLAKYGQR
ncbi:MAG: AAA family ATPase [Candidatus Micrarchaeota archaeon]|nr:AAA family ATPase [Candidatus Micrarchaeota archaeon]